MKGAGRRHQHGFACGAGGGMRFDGNGLLRPLRIGGDLEAGSTQSAPAPHGSRNPYALRAAGNSELDGVGNVIRCVLNFAYCGISSRDLMAIAAKLHCRR